MPTDTFNFFYSFSEVVHEGGHNLGSHQLTIALTDTAPDNTNDLILTDIAEIAYTNLLNNPTSRNLTTSSSTQTTGVYKLVVASLQLEADGGDLPTFRYVVYYNNDHASDALIGWVDYGVGGVTVLDGETFDITHDGTNGLFTVTYPTT